MSRTLKNSKINPGTDALATGDSEGNAKARAHASALAIQADSDGSEFEDRDAAKAALEKGLSK